jgi:hypothetical protein
VLSHIAEQKRVRDRSGRFNQKTFFEPVADRFVVPFQRCISNGDCNNKKDHPNTQAVTHRYFIFGYPARVKVNERVMGDIKRVRYIAEKLTRFICKFPGNIAPGTDGNYQRENNDDAKCFIQTIHPQMRTAADPRYKQHDGYQQAAYGKGIFNMDKFSHPPE